jgi:hypothetical protein
MITLRCTKKLLDFLEVDSIDDPHPSTGALGDWYANLVPTHAGDLIIFVDERTLITVAVPIVLVEELLPIFRERVANLLIMLNVPLRKIEQELSHYQEFEFARTASRSVLGSINDIAWHYQSIAERGDETGSISLSDTEYRLSHMPSLARDFIPARAARAIFANRWQNNGAS